MDSENGRIPSPIINDRFVMLPISKADAPITYSQIRACGYDLGKIAGDLSGQRVAPGQTAHLDPDLDSKSLPREARWRETFGQADKSASHLLANGVTVGDLFLFFGWYRKADHVGGVFRYLPEPGFHAFFGWLQVGCVVDCSDFNGEDFKWAKTHPHFFGTFGKAFVAARELKIGERKTGQPGAGVFGWDPALRLTMPGQDKRSVWKMPEWFFPHDGTFPMTYHGTAARYTKHAEFIEVRTVAKGQEFVIHTDQYPKAVPWACRLVQKGCGG
jgi:hypothetical protein